ncbi:hypothetical protein Tco_1474612 [Tanacetum coccineum]
MHRDLGVCVTHIPCDGVTRCVDTVRGILDSRGREDSRRHAQDQEHDTHTLNWHGTSSSTDNTLHIRGCIGIYDGCEDVVWRKLLLSEVEEGIGEAGAGVCRSLGCNGGPNGDALRKCILEGPYTPSTVIIPTIPATDNSPAVPE